MNSVTVLMSTYNGEDFLQEQIDSVLSQRGVKVQLYVRDDGSTDRTRNILQKYCYRGELHVTFGKNIGWRNSFMELVYNAPESDFYAFCDQDDIWMQDKLYVAIAALKERTEKNTPSLYGSNLYCFRNGKQEGKLNLNSHFTKKSCLIRTLTCGCTFVFNYALCLMLKTNRPKFIEAHDSWVFMSALYFGEVVYDPNAYILYRQHDRNQIGAKISFTERVKRAVKTLQKLGREHSKRLAAEEFLRVYSHYISKADKQIILRFTDYSKGIIPKIRLLFDNGYTTGKRFSDFILKIKILTNTL